MADYPVHYAVSRPARFTRVQLITRLVAFCVLGLVGLTFGAVFMIGYLGLPALAAIRLSSGRAPEQFVETDGRRILTGLRWFAAVSAWAGLVTDRLPQQDPDDTVTLVVDPAEPAPQPTPSSALWRILTGLPSALVLMVLGWIGSLVWLWAALTIVFSERVGPSAFQYLVGLQRWSVRLLLYQASLVDAYPPFSFSDVPPPAVPAARVSV